MKRLSHIVIMICLMAGYASGQRDSSFHLVRSISGDIVTFAIDNLDNLYLLSSTNQLKKLNSNGDSVAVFNDVKKYGQATLIDVSNPLRVLMYYRDFATIVILDRLLNVRNTIDLRKHNILQAKAIGQSYDNKIWIYDEVENKLKKIDEDGSTVLETPDFRQLFNEVPQPQKIFDQDQYVYLYDSTQAIFVFDYYGTLKNKIPITGWKDLKVSGRYVYGSAKNQLHRYDILTFGEVDWRLPPGIAGALSFNFSAGRLYALQRNRIDIFSFQ